MAAGSVRAVDCVVLIVATLVATTLSNHDAKRLYDDLLLKSNYNPLIRPVANASDKLRVKIGLKLSQITKVDEKNEIITTNVWMIHEWHDHSLRWNPREYGNVEYLYVPSQMIWLPDVVLYNNGDGDYTVTMFTKATLHYLGTVHWEPPAVYKSQCDIQVQYFPFDVQQCRIKFGVWTYDGTKVDIEHIDSAKYGLADTEEIEYGVELKDYYRSVEWDLMRASARKTNNVYPCCAEPYPDVTFTLVLRRKTLFYTVNLMIPCISITTLTILTFYLPSDSGEKISLSISLLLSLSLFQLLLMDLVPPTSVTVPLLGKYITFTMIIVSMSVFISVVTLNINFRTASTHTMPAFARKIFLHVLPKLLLMRRPDADKPSGIDTTAHHSSLDSISNGWRDDKQLKRVDSELSNYYDNLQISSTFIGSNGVFQNTDLSQFCEACARRGASRHSLQVQKALDGTVFIAKHMKDATDSKRVVRDWKYFATVIDRLFLYTYITFCVIGSIGIMLSTPTLFDNREPLPDKNNVYSR